MKRANYLTFALMISLTSCHTYQMVSIESPLSKTQQNEFVHENDTFCITYTFNGWNCPVNIDVYNKMDKPLFVDWSQSSLIIDNQRINYWNNQASLVAIANSPAELSGTIYKDEKVSFIPPNSAISVSRFNLKDEFVYIPANYPHNIINLPTETGFIKSKKYVISEGQESMQFRSFLTLSATQDFSQPIYTDDTFWISDVIRTNQNPDYILYKPSNQFYVQKTTGIGKFLLATTAVTLVIISALAAE